MQNVFDICQAKSSFNAQEAIKDKLVAKSSSCAEELSHVKLESVRGLVDKKDIISRRKEQKEYHLQRDKMTQRASFTQEKKDKTDIIDIKI